MDNDLSTRRAIIRRTSACILTMALVTVSGGMSGTAQTSAPASSLAPANASANPAALYFTDVVLLNQHGQEMRFYSDLIKGRTVIVIPFFTSCMGACPLMNKTLAKIQDWLGDRLGKDAYMISLSVDPTVDSVDRLRAYAEKMGSRPGWFFLGGTREHVELALAKLGQRVATPEVHTNLMLIGNDATGLWKKAFSLADSAELIRIVQSVVDDKGDGTK
jgi:protein SCO1/2